MSHKKAGTPKNDNPTGSPRYQSRIKFINPYLSTTDKEWLEDNLQFLPAIISEFIEVCPESCTLSTKYDDKSGRFLATLIDNGVHSPNNGLAVSIRGATRLHALYALAYVLLHVLPAVWEERDAEGDDLWG